MVQKGCFRVPRKIKKEVKKRGGKSVFHTYWIGINIARGCNPLTGEGLNEEKAGE